MNDRSSPLFDRLGRAVRWLRERQGKKQYLVADTAGVTKGMLSAYETGRQKPSLETLEKLLTALDCDLHDLHNAIQIVNERRHRLRFPPASQRARSARRNAEQRWGNAAPHRRRAAGPCRN